jgi:hypothetical protein
LGGCWEGWLARWQVQENTVLTIDLARRLWSFHPRCCPNKVISFLSLCVKV